jgi:hypothetical protein
VQRNGEVLQQGLSEGKLKYNLIDSLMKVCNFNFLRLFGIRHNQMKTENIKRLPS